MNENLLNYNKAIAFIQKGHYAEAENLLRTLAQTGHALSNWALGLVYAATGRPVAALIQWEKVSPDEVAAVPDKIGRLQATLQTYEKIFTLYNEAIEKASQKDFASLPQLFLDLFEQGKGMPLPVEIYKGWFLSLLACGDINQFNKALEEVPEYVRNDTAIKAISLKVKESELGSAANRAENKAVSKKHRFVRMGLLAGAAILMLSTGIAVERFLDNDSAKPVSSKEIPERSSLEFVNQEKALKEQIASLEKENSALQSEMDNQSAELQQKSETVGLLELADVNIENIKENGAFKQYRSGLENYRSGQYQTAVEKFEKSISLSKTPFFADDAHFFLIQSAIKSGDDQKAITEIEAFLKESDGNSDSYHQSPYLDDVMLMRAESYLESGDQENGIEWLDRIETEFPNEWTAKKAKSLRVK
ncbi:tetratricopeptide repeat protein [Neobacillus sp. SCS-31]|uniref:tetratricopeptide repeat protein n=1 Tax=Neobacillus oceani TaxID=3115292 RepID=UPI0039064323